MSQLVEKLVCENLKTLEPYQSARRLYSGGQDWMNANESPFANQYELDCDKLNRYPSCQPAAVIQGYASYAEVTEQQLLVSRGADESIELLIRTFCTPGKDRILICPPTYGMYAISAETCDVAVEKVPSQADFSLDVEAICQHVGKVKLVFICSPNNPTGNDIGVAQVEAVLDAFKDSALVVVDEAYIEFSEQASWASRLNNYNNLVVLRTLSKAFALAGIRCGFTLSNSAVIDAMMKVIAPYPVPEPVAQIAAQALSPEGLARTALQVQILNQQKQWLQEQLSTMDAFSTVGNMAANFILVRCKQSAELMKYLVAQGILIRDQSKQLNLQNCLRISVGTADQNQRLINAINEFFEGQ